VSESLSGHTAEPVTGAPYRCIETSRTLMRGGTLVTTTTTTTDRLKDIHSQSRYSGKICTVSKVYIPPQKEKNVVSEAFY